MNAPEDEWVQLEGTDEACAAYEYDEGELDLMEAGVFIDLVSGDECTVQSIVQNLDGHARVSVLLTVGEQKVLIPIPALHSLHGYPWLYEEVSS